MSSQDNKKRTITVLGALGNQGKSVVKAFLEDGTFNIRAVTRSVDSEAAKSLQDHGVQVVSGDTKKPETLVEAFKGADAAFIVVNFWDPEVMSKELELTKSILAIAKEAGVKHAVYSALADVESVSNGKMDVPHFTMKAQAYEYAKTLGFDYVTAVEAAFYYANWFTFFKPTEADDGTLVWTFPGKGKISQYAPEQDTGAPVLAAAKDPHAYNGKYILLEGDSLTPEESVAVIAKKLGKQSRVDYVEPEKFSKFFPGAHEIAEMIRWFDEYGYYGPETKERKLGSGKKAAGKIMPLEDWLETEEFKQIVAKSA